MLFARRIAFILPALLLAGAGVAGHSIPADQLDAGQIYYGSPAEFSTPSEVDLNAVIEATPEYEKIRKERIDHGTGRYWILLSQATDRAHRATAKVGAREGYDLVAEIGYLGSLEPAIASVDITELVVEELSDK